MVDGDEWKKGKKKPKLPDQRLQVLTIGTLYREPVIESGPGGFPVGKAIIAVQNRDHTSLVRIITIGKQAEDLEKLALGELVEAVGDARVADGDVTIYADHFHKAVPEVHPMAAMFGIQPDEDDAD